MSVDSIASVQHDIEQILDALDEATEEFAEVALEAARAEVEYKRRLNRSIVALADRGTMADGRKSTADWRKAQAELSATDEEMVHRLADARMRAIREGIFSKRARLDALRTLAANVRGQAEFGSGSPPRNAGRQGYP